MAPLTLVEPRALGGNPSAAVCRAAANGSVQGDGDTARSGPPAAELAAQ
jgi:hypothetical protein